MTTSTTSPTTPPITPYIQVLLFFLVGEGTADVESGGVGEEEVGGTVGPVAELEGATDVVACEEVVGPGEDEGGDVVVCDGVEEGGDVVACDEVVGPGVDEGGDVVVADGVVAGAVEVLDVVVVVDGAVDVWD